MAQELTRVSHLQWPYVQRAPIVLTKKGIAIERINIDPANKPDWFLKISPLGKTPVLLVEGPPILESAVFCEYLEESTPSALHPQDPLARAQHRGWMECGSSVLSAIAGFYAAADNQQLAAKAVDITAKFGQLEIALNAIAHDPYFAGERFSMVDAVFGPLLRYFDLFDAIDNFGFFAHTPKVRPWRAALAALPSVRDAVRADYPDLLRSFLHARQSALSRRIVGICNVARAKAINS